jgi:hypothetical protein
MCLGFSKLDNNLFFTEKIYSNNKFQQRRIIGALDGIYTQKVPDVGH